MGHIHGLLKDCYRWLSGQWDSDSDVFCHIAAFSVPQYLALIFHYSCWAWSILTLLIPGFSEWPLTAHFQRLLLVETLWTLLFIIKMASAFYMLSINILWLKVRKWKQLGMGKYREKAASNSSIFWGNWQLDWQWGPCADFLWAISLVNFSSAAIDVAWSSVNNGFLKMLSPRIAFLKS